MPWLDAARYADTHGYHIDSIRGMWPWRDWVIGAFNRNVPFDQFAIEQLAGDLLPNATTEQKIASGFNRNHMINFEGGAIAAEYQVEYVMDRVEATSSAFMGLTMGCARCHSHKFDPITHKEFYQFFAFFNTVPELGLDGRTGNAAPVPSVAVARPTGAARRARGGDQDDESRRSQTRWSRRCRASGRRTFSEKIASTRGDGLVAQYELDGNFSDISGPVPARPHGQAATRPSRSDRSAERSPSTETPRSASATSAASTARTASASPCGSGDVATSRWPSSRSWTTTQHRRGYEWLLDDIALVGIQRWAARLTITLASDAAGSAIQIRSRERLRLGDWHHVAVDVRRLGPGRRPSPVCEWRAARYRSRARHAGRIRSRPRPRSGSGARRSANRSSGRSTICGCMTAC